MVTDNERDDTPLALPAPLAAETVPRAPLLPEWSDFLEGGDRPAAAQVEG
jgi:hypothetical protein